MFVVKSVTFLLLLVFQYKGDSFSNIKAFRISLFEYLFRLKIDTIYDTSDYFCITSELI